MHELAIFCCLIVAVCGDIYQDPGNPYDDGPLPVDSRIINPSANPINPAPMHSKVYYPYEANMTESHTYGVFYFVSGFFGVMPPALYDDLMFNVAAHGYFGISVWPLITGDGANFTAEAHIENIEFLKENLPRNIRDLADFDYIGLGGHSSGCAPTLGMARLDTDPYLATVNIEPVTLTIVGGADFVLPSINLGAELANGSCSTPNFDYERFYNEFQCPKILIEAEGVGHCDVLVDAARDVCVAANACATSEDTDLPAYRRFVQGMTAAFLNGYVQGNPDMLDYVTDPANIPHALLQHRMDMEC